MELLTPRELDVSLYFHDSETAYEVHFFITKTKERWVRTTNYVKLQEVSLFLKSNNADFKHSFPPLRRSKLASCFSKKTKSWYISLKWRLSEWLNKLLTVEFYSKASPEVRKYLSQRFSGTSFKFKLEKALASRAPSAPVAAAESLVTEAIKSPELPSSSPMSSSSSSLPVPLLDLSAITRAQRTASAASSITITGGGSQQDVGPSSAVSSAVSSSPSDTPRVGQTHGQRFDSKLQLFTMDVTSDDEVIMHSARKEEFEVVNFSSVEALSFSGGIRDWILKEVISWMNPEASPLPQLSPRRNRRASFKSSTSSMKSLLSVKLPPKPPATLFWIQGEPDVGSASFIAGVASKLRTQHQLLATFYCHYNQRERMSIHHLVRSIASQCARSLPSMAATFEEAFRAVSVDDWNPVLLFKRIVLGPLSANETPRKKLSAILIDKIDSFGLFPSCRAPLLELINVMATAMPSWVRILVTSKPDVDIIKALTPLQPKILYDSDSGYDMDNRRQLQAMLTEAFSSEELPFAIQAAIDRSKGKPFYLTAAVPDTLQETESKTLQAFQSSLPAGLFEWYRQVLGSLRDRDSEYYDEHIVRLLSVLMAAREPLAQADIASLLSVTSSEQGTRLLEAVNFLVSRSVLVVPATATLDPSDLTSPSPADELQHPVVSRHRSFIDWLSDEHSSGDVNEQDFGCVIRQSFYVPKRSGDEYLAQQLMAQVKVLEWLDNGEVGSRPVAGAYFFRHALMHAYLADRVEQALNLCFRLQYLLTAIEVIGALEVIYSIHQLTAMVKARNRPLVEVNSLLLLTDVLLAFRLAAHELTNLTESNSVLVGQLVSLEVPRELSLVLQLQQEASLWTSHRLDGFFFSSAGKGPSTPLMESECLTGLMAPEGLLSCAGTHCLMQ